MNLHSSKSLLTAFFPADAGLNSISADALLFICSSSDASYNFCSTSTSKYISLHSVCVMWIHISCFVRECLCAHICTHKGCVCVHVLCRVWACLWPHADVNVEFESAQLSSGYPTCAECFVVQENWLCSACLRKTYNCDDSQPAACCIGIGKVVVGCICHRVIAAYFTSVLLFTVSSA